ncbi:hypothetical protein FC80_GL001563 [Liquorilactobacillus cacaonum DSM 21116]|uniref:Uncharacterized protein n=1 Tax=Liquorilactobacillus cacaonum DSM 21116 TaxID=1423729 RepID=A0A0R2CNN9_9LACO|nr:hypothetical protein FC80_GL001563 [Liquorilactobacillus cacaonum DSM 21116]
MIKEPRNKFSFLFIYLIISFLTSMIINKYSTKANLKNNLFRIVMITIIGLIVNP